MVRFDFVLDEDAKVYLMEVGVIRLNLILLDMYI